jgi:fumarylacetoacetase
MDALAPFKCPAPEQDPKPLSYLRSESDRTYDIHLEVNLTPESSDTSETIVRSNFNYLYWDVHQQLAHHTVTGCNVRTGDLMASGTISGPAKKNRGSLLELTWRGEEPITLSSGETRKFLQDGDTVTLTGWCQGEGYRVGFGECTGKILPAIKE